MLMYDKSVAHLIIDWIKRDLDNANRQFAAEPEVSTPATTKR
jgi:hypothetical protein